MSKNIKIGIIGLGNCASALIQGIEYYKNKNKEDAIGLMHWEIGGYKPYNIEIVSAFDIDKRKVGKDISDAIFSLPNCTKVFYRYIPRTDIKVRMGRILDGFSSHMSLYQDDYTFLLSDKRESSKEDIIEVLKESGTHILLNYLPVGSQLATEFYAECALDAGVSLINCIPQFIASDPTWANRFKARGIPIIGDDVKSQIGATILHRALTQMIIDRGGHINNTWQLNYAGNCDFLNMSSRDRLKSKKISKTDAVQSILNESRLDNQNIHIGPSDYIPHLKDNKLCDIRIDFNIFADIVCSIDCKLSVEDSPNSGGIIIDAIRCAKLALDKGIGGVLIPASAYYMKHPIQQMRDEDARKQLEEFISQSKY